MTDREGITEVFRIEVHLWIRKGQRSAFRAFEDAAFEIMGSYGATVIDIRTPEPGGTDVPDEIHLINFPDVERFTAYQSDPRLLSLADARATCIARTEIRTPEVS